MTHFGAGDETIQAQLIESVPDERAAGFGSQTSPPVRFGNVEGQHGFILATPAPVETAIADVPLFRLEDGSHKANLIVGGLQVDLMEPPLSFGARQRPSPDVPANVRISDDIAVIIQIA